MTRSEENTGLKFMVSQTPLEIVFTFLRKIIVSLININIRNSTRSILSIMSFLWWQSSNTASGKKPPESESESHPVMSDSLQPHCYTDLGILQARILEWVPVPFCRGTSQHRDWTQISCIAGGFFTRNHQPGKPQNSGVSSLSLLQEIFPIQQSNRVSCIACKTQETSWSILIQEPCNFINSFWGATTNRETYFVQGIQNGIHFIPYGYHSLLRTKCTK